MLGALSILLQIHTTNPFVLRLMICLPKPVLGVLIGYSALAGIIEGVFAALELREFAKPFDSCDEKDLGEYIEFDRRIAGFDKPILEHTASFLESRSKKIENLRQFLVGVFTLGSGLLGILLWPGSPAKAGLADKIPANAIIAVQFLLFCALLGALFAIISGWQRGINCASRALTLRRILENRETILNIDGPQHDAGVP